MLTNLARENSKFAMTTTTTTITIYTNNNNNNNKQLNWITFCTSQRLREIYTFFYLIIIFCFNITIEELLFLFCR